MSRSEQIIDGQIQSQNGNQRKVRQGRADRQLDREVNLLVLVWWPGIDKQPIERNGEGWKRPLFCSTLKEADDDYAEYMKLYKKQIMYIYVLSSIFDCNFRAS